MTIPPKTLATPLWQQKSYIGVLSWDGLVLLGHGRLDMCLFLLQEASCGNFLAVAQELTQRREPHRHSLRWSCWFGDALPGELPRFGGGEMVMCSCFKTCFGQCLRPRMEVSGISA